MKRMKKQCPICNEQFIPKTVTSVYCSDKCGKKAYQQKKSQLKKEEKLKVLADKIPENRLFISVPEATILFGIAKTTLYRLIRQEKIPAVNLGTRLVRIDRKVMEEMFPISRTLPEVKAKPEKKLYSLEKEDCYSIGEIAKRFHISESSVNKHIRKYSIPTRQIGNYVYAPKIEIDNLYNGK
ncbi:DNA-binding protein [Elizabethkingia anophelis]|nr:DNA-binding protein [Elizabethkingia anophelis]